MKKYFIIILAITIFGPLVTPFSFSGAFMVSIITAIFVFTRDKKDREKNKREIKKQEQVMKQVKFGDKLIGDFEDKDLKKIE